MASAVTLIYRKVPTLNNDYNPGDMPESTDVTPPAHNQSQPPAPIAQLAWLLHSILSQEPEGNDSILHALTMASSASSEMAPLTSDSLNHEGLAFLSGHWAILANIQYLLNEVLRLLSFATATALRIQFGSSVGVLPLKCK